MQVLTADRVFTPDLRPGAVSVRIVDGIVAGLDEPATAGVRLPPGWFVTPGLVQMHVHGGGGFDMTSGRPDALSAALRWHLARGATTTVVSLITAPLEHLERTLGVIAGVVESDTDHTLPDVLGSHLEGPFLSAERRGVHDPRLLLPPDRHLLRRLVSAARGTLRMVTLAPELNGALAAVDELLHEGIVVALGHTDAPTATVRDAVRRGASVATHLFNGMRPIHHRDPGPVGVLLDEPTVICEVIGDDMHLDPVVTRLAVQAAGSDRIALVTDAVAATGGPDGEYSLGTGRSVRLGGVLRSAAGSSLAGGTESLAGLLSRAVRRGTPLTDAVRSLTIVPARALQVSDRAGRIVTGRPADLCVFDADCNLQGVMRRGRWARYWSTELGGVKLS